MSNIWVKGEAQASVSRYGDEDTVDGERHPIDPFKLGKCVDDLSECEQSRLVRIIRQASCGHVDQGDIRPGEGLKAELICDRHVEWGNSHSVGQRVWW